MDQIFRLSWNCSATVGPRSGVDVAASSGVGGGGGRFGAATEAGSGAGDIYGAGDRYGLPSGITRSSAPYCADNMFFCPRPYNDEELGSG